MKHNKLPGLPCTLPNILEVLKRVYDPEIEMNIVDLGLIYGISIGKDHIHIEFTATSPGCPVIEVIEKTITHELNSAFNSKKITTTLIWHTPWDASLMNEDTRIALGY